MKEIKTVGVIGSGTMGQGIAQVCASSGFSVFLFDITPELISKAFSAIEKNLQSSIEKNKISFNQKIEIIERIRPVSTLEEVKADLIIEAAFEKLEIKRDIFKIIETVNDISSVFTTNTSSISVTQIASGLKNPSRLAGLHFFNPATAMKLVEIIKGANTGAQVLETLKIFCKKISKTHVEVKDSPGFIVNRVARHFYVESLKLVEDGVSDLNTIDALLRSSGFKMGAFELMDLIGVDTNLSVTVTMFQAFHQDPKFRPNRIQQQKVDAGHYGRKSGKGFYDYTQN